MKPKYIILNLALALTALATAHTTTIVPGGFDTVFGNGQGNDPFDIYGTGGSRFQQVYNASLFTGFTNAESITSVAFRPKQNQFGSFIGNSLSISNLSVQLSTTSRNDVIGLSGIFADNIGSNVKTVFTGPLTLTAIGSTSSVSAFDYLITFQSPFLYDRSQGNLLLDILIPDNAVVSGDGKIGFRQIDTITDGFPSADGMSTARGATGSATIGSNSTLAVISRFTSTPVTSSVPDSGSILLLLAPVLALMPFMRQRMLHAAA
ncbi:MAG: hypothetical protein ABI273_07725 [Lacunisphaera sp.]